MRIRLLTFEGCPNVIEAQQRLADALKAEGLDPKWQEVEVCDIDSAMREGLLGSPSIQIDGQDIETPRRGEKPSWSCRTYRDACGNVSGAPPVEMIRSAIRQSRGKRNPSRGLPGFWRSFSALPGAGAALLPIAVCPVCLPAYLGFLSAVGLGFLLQTKYLLPMTAGLLGIALGALAYRARQRRGFGPLILGACATVLIITSRFVLNFDPALYLGVSLLLTASVWNAWPRKRRNIAARASCTPMHTAGESRRVMRCNHERKATS